MDADFMRFGSSPNIGDVSMRKDWPATDNRWLFIHRQSMLVKHPIDMILPALVIAGKGL